MQTKHTLCFVLVLVGLGFELGFLKHCKNAAMLRLSVSMLVRVFMVSLL
jgi:hypothetical protein